MLVSFLWEKKKLACDVYVVSTLSFEINPQHAEVKILECAENWLAVMVLVLRSTSEGPGRQLDFFSLDLILNYFTRSSEPVPASECTPFCRPPAVGATSCLPRGLFHTLP